MGKWDLRDGESPDDRPDLFEGRLIAWFEARVRWILENEYEDDVIDQLVAERESLLVWKPGDSYQGEGYSTGTWIVDAGAVVAAVRRITGREPMLYHCRPTLNEPRLIAWFQASVRTLAKAALDLAKPAGVDPEAVLADLTARREEFLSYHPDEGYAGAGYHAGQWKLNVKKVTDHIRVILDARRNAIEYHGLPPAYRLAGNAGVIGDDGKPTREVEEPIYYMFSDKMPSTAKLWAWRKKREQYPRLCRDCRKEYRPENGNQSVRCGDCLDRRRGRPDQRRRKATSNQEGQS